MITVSLLLFGGLLYLSLSLFPPRDDGLDLLGALFVLPLLAISTFVGIIAAGSWFF